jgi:hypothetical protein
MDNTTREKNWDWRRHQPWVKRIYNKFTKFHRILKCEET